MPNYVLSQESNSFIKRSDFPGAGRQGGVCFQVNDRIYAGLGATIDVYYNDLWEYDPSTNLWTEKTPFPGGARSAAVSIVIGDRVFVGLGATSTSMTNDWWEYDVLNNSWIQKGNYPGAGKAAAFAFTIDALGFVGSGRNNQGSMAQDFWEYNPLNDTWRQLADFAGPGRFFGVGFSIGQKGYVGTGTIAFGSASFSKDFWCYDRINNTWERKADFGGDPRSFAAGFALKGKGYIGFGSASINFNSTYKSDLWRYNPDQDLWESIINLPHPTSGLRTAVTTKRAYLIFGARGNPNIPSVTYTKDFWEYIPESGLIIKTLKTSICQGGSFELEYEADQLLFSSDNVIEVQLSDTDGSFENPTVLSSITKSDLNGIVSFNVPETIAVGTSYKIRIVSSNELAFGIPFDQEITIHKKELVIDLISPQFPVCEGTPISFSVSYQDEFTQPTIEWFKNGIKQAEESSTYSSEDGFINGDNVYCKLIRNNTNCINSIVSAEPIQVIFEAKAIPTISILSDKIENRVCSGEPIKFSTEIENGGDAPIFIWKKNGTILSETTDEFLTNSLNDKDLIRCELITSQVCVTDQVVESNTITINVLPIPPKPIITMSGNVLSSSYDGGQHQWLLNGFDIEGATNHKYEIVENGIYQVRYTSICSSLSDPYNAIFTGAEKGILSDYIIFPNPFNSFLNVVVNQERDQEVIEIEISNSLGVVVYVNNNFNLGEAIDLTSLIDGIYFIRINDNQGSVFNRLVKK